MSDTKDLSNCTKAVRDEAKKISKQHALKDIISEEDYDFLLNESVRVSSNPELDIIVINIKDHEYKRRIGGHEAGSTQNISTAIRAKLSKEVKRCRQYVKSIDEIISLETELEIRNHNRNLYYRIINTFAIYSTIIITSMIAHYCFGVNLALVNFKNKSETIDCKNTPISNEQMTAVLKAIENQHIAAYVEKKLTENYAIPPK